VNSYPSCNLKISGSSEEFFSALGRIRAAEEASYSRDHQIYEDRRRNKRSGYSFDFHHENRDIFVIHLWTFQGKRRIFFAMPKGKSAEAQKSEVLQGTLDLMVLKVLDALGPQHGYGIARRIEQVSEQVLQLNEGTCHFNHSLAKNQPYFGQANSILNDLHAMNATKINHSLATRAVSQP